MSIQDSIGVYDIAEFAENPEPRCPVVLILDTSPCTHCESGPIEALYQGMPEFSQIIQSDPVAALRADIAIVVCGLQNQVVFNFTNGTDFYPPELPPIYEKSYSSSINLALDMIEARKQSYRDGGIPYYRSLVYFLADGAAKVWHPHGKTSSENDSDLMLTGARVTKMERDRSIAFFTFGLIHADGYGSLQRLGLLASPHRPPVRLDRMEQVANSLQWLSRSVAAVSQSQPGESIRLPQQDLLDF